MTNSYIELVDNQQFFDFILEEPNPVLNEDTAKLFLSSSGARPFTSWLELRDGLDAMFQERVDRGLSFLILADAPFFGSVESCS